MVHLTLAGTSEDGRRLLLVDDAGVEHTLDVDARLRSAVRGTPRPGTSRPGQLENTMESALRPRDIQARIRAGESPEAVAEAAQTDVERIMTYAGPVLAERAHVAERAQRSSVRRRSGEGARTLGEAVETHLRSVDAGAASVEWDAWRREDGRWVLRAAFATPSRTGNATFTYDVPGSYVVAEDDDARWLVGEVIATATLPPTRDDLEEARRRRLAASREELPLDVDVPGEDRADEAPAPIEAYLEAGDATSDRAADRATDRAAERTDTTADTADDPAGSEEPATDERPEPEVPTRRAVRKTRGRASVPSWDEIMFGGSKD